MYRQIYGEDCNNVDIAGVLKNLADNHEHAGDWKKAGQRYKEALAMYKAAQPNHWNIQVISIYLLGRTLFIIMIIIIIILINLIIMFLFFSALDNDKAY